MKSKMTKSSQLSTTEPIKTKNKLSKQLEQEQNHRNGDHMEGYQWGRGEENGENGTGNKQHKWWVQNRQGEVKNSIGNGEFKELIYTTHGHEIRLGNDGGQGTGQRGIKGRKKWDNCNSIINKIYFKKLISFFLFTFYVN